MAAILCENTWVSAKEISVSKSRREALNIGNWISKNLQETDNIVFENNVFDVI